MELINFLQLVIILLVIIGMVCGVAWGHWVENNKTARRGSKYYVPKIGNVKFDPFFRRWTPEWKDYVRRDHQWWDDRFNGRV
jgi:hypothetical protein